MSEKIADIVVQMRGRGEDGRMDKSLWRQYADRIEAAAKRERAEAEADALAVGGIVEAERHKPGNAAAMREALVKIRGIAKTFMDATRMRRVTDSARIDVGDIEDSANAALAALLRNCDVGTAEEQSERHKAYCRKHFTPDQLGGNCHKCPLKDKRGWSCQLAWAQRPYEAQEGGTI